MADNVTLPGAGTVILTEDVGQGRQMPVSKIWTGASGSAGGPVTAQNAFPVTAVSGALENGNLATIASRIPQNGRAPSSGSLPVVLPRLFGVRGNVTPPAAGVLLYSGSCTVRTYHCVQRGPNAYVQLSDGTTQPASGSAPVMSFLMGNNTILYPAAVDVPFDNGIYMSYTNTLGGYTAVTLAPTGSFSYSFSLDV